MPLELPLSSTFALSARQSLCLTSNSQIELLTQSTWVASAQATLSLATSANRRMPRAVMNGKPQFLQVERVTDWIRTLLLAGIRSATLWMQLGGNRFELMFGRRRIMQDAQRYLTP